MKPDPLAPNTSLGQHWLHDKDILESIVSDAAVSGQDTVLEVGPGLGTLTTLLAKQAKKVLAVEFDKRLANALPKAVPAANLEVIHQDILSFDLTNLPSSYKVVANIPYYLTSNLIRRLQEADNPPTRSVLLVQKEVARRIAAGPGSERSLLSVSAQFFCDVSLSGEVPAEYFTPPPKVDSQVVVLQRKTTLPDVDQKQFFRILKAGFGERRKKLINSLAGGLTLDKNTVRGVVVDELKMKETARAQELTLEQWLALTKALRVLL